MKKILLIFVLMINLAACSKENLEINYTEVKTYDVDMSVYEKMSSTDHHFKGILPSDLIKLIKDGGSGIIYMGYKDCPNCQDSVKFIEDAAESLGVNIYYLDCYNNIEPLTLKLKEIIDILSPILRENDNGDKTIFTPHVFTVINGELKESIIGLASENENKIVDAYKEIMKAFEVSK